MQWLRDGLKLFTRAEESEPLASAANPAMPLVFVPGFVGLGAPHWIPDARGAMFGLTRDTSAADLARAALEGVAFQVADLIEAARHDAGVPLPELRVDGGMARNAWFLQRQADVLGIPVAAAAQSEATALGAAFLAGLRVGLWKSLDELRRIAAEGRRFEPRWGHQERQRRLAQWHRAVKAVLLYHGSE